MYTNMARAQLKLVQWLEIQPFGVPHAGNIDRSLHQLAANGIVPYVEKTNELLLNSQTCCWYTLPENWLSAFPTTFPHMEPADREEWVTIDEAFRAVRQELANPTKPLPSLARPVQHHEDVFVLAQGLLQGTYEALADLAVANAAEAKQVGFGAAQELWMSRPDLNKVVEIDDPPQYAFAFGLVAMPSPVVTLSESQRAVWHRCDCPS